MPIGHSRWPRANLPREALAEWGLPCKARLKIEEFFPRCVEP